jgi:hypothetical protein
MTGCLPPISSSWRQAPWDSRHSNFIFQVNTCCYSPYVTFWRQDGSVIYNCCWSSSAQSLMSEPRGTHDHILLSQIRDSHNLEGQVPVFIYSRNRVSRLYPQALGPFFVASYYSQGYGGGIWPRLHTRGEWLGWCPPYVTRRHGPRREHRFQQLLYCCAWTRWGGNLFVSRSLLVTGLHATI